MTEEGRSGEFEPVYLALADVLELHALIIGATADEAADQLRNRAGLEGALARPETYAHYQDADLALQAAVLAHGIAGGQQFIDGNKRTALIAMLVFLEVTGWRIEASDPDLLRHARWQLVASPHPTLILVPHAYLSSVSLIGSSREAVGRPGAASRVTRS